MWVIRCVARGLGLVWWRHRALTPMCPPDMPPHLDLSSDEAWKLALENEQLRGRGGVSRDSMDAFARNGARAIESVLSPWLNGERQLDYSFLAGVVRWIMAGMQLQLPERDPT